MATEKVKIEKHVPKLQNRTDSMFYYGEHIATLSKGKKKVFVESSGEMQAYFGENEVYRNDMLSKELRSRGITDRKLAKMVQNDQVLMNNWFRIVVEGADSEEIAYDYDEAIETALGLFED